MELYQMEMLYQISVSVRVPLLLVSLFMFLLFKVRRIRSRRDVQSAHITSLSRTCLELLTFPFGLNTIVQFHTAVSYIIGSLFIILGAYNIRHFNAARKYFKGNLPIEEKAWEEFERKQRQSGK